MDNMKKEVKMCHYCRGKIVDKEYDLSDNKDINKCREWLDNCSLSDLSDGSADEENSISDVSNTTEDNCVAVFKNDNIRLRDEIIVESDNNTIEFENIIEKKSNHYENIHIHKAKNIHIGDVTHIHGPVYINKLTPNINHNIIINQTRINQNKKFCIVSRKTWLAQPPFDPDDIQYLEQPAKFVIISHSASEEAYTQTDNNLSVRLIQQFHIESRKWNDISYNFLIGAEGSIYEGRGWNVVGAHAFGYNRLSIGLCFIGYYMQKLPPTKVLEKTQEFIKYGVEIGAIAEDYVLLGHCQCSSTASPGRRLFEEIKTWDHWDGSINPNNPSPLIRQSCQQ